MTEVLRASNVETMYGRVMAIRGISLTVKEGSVVTVMGSNGAGKTTILKTISGALDPFKGQVEFEGRDITALDPDVIARAGIARETMKQCVVVGFQDQVCRIGKVSFLLLLLHLDVQQNKPEKSYNCACK